MVRITGDLCRSWLEVLSVLCLPHSKCRRQRGCTLDDLAFSLVHACDVPVAGAMLIFYRLDMVLIHYSIKAQAFSYLMFKNRNKRVRGSWRITQLGEYLSSRHEALVPTTALEKLGLVAHTTYLQSQHRLRR